MGHQRLGQVRTAQAASAPPTGATGVRAQARMGQEGSWSMAAPARRCRHAPGHRQPFKAAWYRFCRWACAARPLQRHQRRGVLKASSCASAPAAKAAGRRQIRPCPAARHACAGRADHRPGRYADLGHTGWAQQTTRLDFSGRGIALAYQHAAVTPAQVQAACASQPAHVAHGEPAVHALGGRAIQARAHSP